MSAAADDSTNTTLFIGGLSPSVTEAELHAAFLRFGEIVYTKIPLGKGCGFVQFLNRAGAEYALSEMNGFLIGGQSIRIAWGKSTGKAPPGGRGQGPPPYSAGGYGYSAQGYAADPYAQAYPAAQGYGPQGYATDPYAGYAAYAPVDPYAAAYAGYSVPPMGPAPSSYPPPAAAGPASPPPSAPHTQAPSQAPAAVYDPLAPVNYDKLNMAYMQRQLPVLTGGCVRTPAPLPLMAHHVSSA
ncbi:hypothetical protein V8C86DRAFT_2629371 [Haematococcus lacustris]